jgi:hypothetical protein
LLCGLLKACITIAFISKVLYEYLAKVNIQKGCGAILQANKRRNALFHKALRRFFEYQLIDNS